MLNGPRADFIVVVARTSGEQRDKDGISLFLVDAKAEGLSRRDYPTVDAFRASELSFENVKVEADSMLGEDGAGLSILQRVIDEATLAIGSERLVVWKSCTRIQLNTVNNVSSSANPSENSRSYNTEW